MDYNSLSPAAFLIIHLLIAGGRLLAAMRSAGIASCAFKMTVCIARVALVVSCRCHFSARRRLKRRIK